MFIFRFLSLELMFTFWSGPGTVVAYVTDEESISLLSKIQRSTVLHNRTNIAYHVVFKRHASLILKC